MTEAEALQAQEHFQSQWDKTYPVIAKSWRANWNRVKPMFELPAEIRQAVYTTNVTREFEFQLAQNPQKSERLPARRSRLSLVVFGLGAHQSKWTMPIKNWKAALQQFAILFEDRLSLPALAQLLT